jgi:hypothetical protein
MPSGYPVAVHALGATDMKEARSQGLNSHDALKEAEEMRKLLIAFALKRGRSIVTPDWDRVALLVAAFEHPELQLSKRQSTHRKRGRPALPRGLSTIVSGPWPAPIRWPGSMACPHQVARFKSNASWAWRPRLRWPAKRVGVAQPATARRLERVGGSPARSAVAGCCSAAASLR